MPAQHHNHPEHDERKAVADKKPECRLIKHGKIWKLYPPEWVERITRIAQIQEQLQDEKRNGLDWRDNQFTANQKDIAGVWPAMRTGSYAVPSSATTQTKWRNALIALEASAKANLRRVDARTMLTQGVAGYIERTDYTAIKAAIQRAKERATALNPDRIVGYVADTGCGKTAMIKHLKNEGIIDWSVEATPAWTSSYRAFLLSLSDMWELPTEGMTELELETLILTHAKTLPGVFVLDELDTLGRKSLGLVKRLLNESMLVVGLFMTPQTYEELKRTAIRKDKTGSQVKQLLRRFEAQIKASPVTETEVQQLSPEVWKGATAAQLHLVASEANLMGGIDAAKRIAANVADLDGPLSDEKVKKAMKLYRMAVPAMAPAMERRVA